MALEQDLQGVERQIDEHEKQVSLDFFIYSVFISLVMLLLLSASLSGASFFFLYVICILDVTDPVARFQSVGDDCLFQRNSDRFCLGCGSLNGSSPLAVRLIG